MICSGLLGSPIVIPAKAGTQFTGTPVCTLSSIWIPACAGMTK